MSECPHCERNRYRASLWRAEAYRQSGHDVIEWPWTGLTKEDVYALANKHLRYQPEGYEVSGVYDLAQAIDALLREKNRD